MADSGVSFAFSDFVLNRQVCDCCQKYLSVTPVKVYPNRKIKCGRCSTNSKEENGAASLYNNIAEKSLFKCINRFDGCIELLRSSEVTEHELICISKKYTCPICFEELFSYLMISHFKFYHVKSLLDTPSFMVNDINLRQNYLYQLDNHLFFVTLSDVSDSICENLRKFSLNLSPFGDGSFVKSFRANFIQFDKDNNNQFFSKCITYPMTCSVDLNITSHSSLVVNFCVEMVEPNGGITRITQKTLKHEDLREDLPSANSSTSNQNNNFICKNNDSKNIHKIMKAAIGNSLKILYSRQRDILPNEAFKKSVSNLSFGEGATITFTKSDEKYTVTLACYDCSLIYPCGFISDKTIKVYFTGDNNHYYLSCYFCEKSKEEQAILTFDELNNISFFCIWDCCKYFQYKQLYEHERSCEKQIQQKCPVKSCSYYSKLFELRNHFEEQHSTIFFDNSRCSMIDSKISQESVEHILLMWCICVHVKFEWKKPFWEVTLSHEIPDAEIRLVIRNLKGELICSTTRIGSFRHCDEIEVYLYLPNP